MSSNLYEASHQWSTRPDDERFESLQAMYDATKSYAESARTGTALINDLRVEANADTNNLHLIGTTGAHAKLTHYSFGQLARFAGAPSEYLRKLPVTLAAQNINHGLKKAGTGYSENKLSLLFHQNGSLVTRAITSDHYDRVWNYEVVGKIAERLGTDGWVVPPARPVRSGQKGIRKATAADILPNQGDFGLAVKVGDDIAPAGLYASDHDMFAFLVQMGSNTIQNGNQLLNRGVFIQNSEVGDCALKFKFFVMDQVCGNHIAWGVRDITEISVRHVKSGTQQHGKTLTSAFSRWNVMVNRQPKSGQLEADIKAARNFELGATKEKVLEAAFGFGKTKGLNMLTKSTLTAAYELAEKTPRYGNPNTVWALVNGLTEYSQNTSFTDARTELDSQAGRLMEIAF